MASRARGPPNGGWGWMCVLGKLFSYSCILGIHSAFGVIYVDIIDYFNTSREEAAWIGSLSYGLTFLSGPLSSILTSRFGIQKTTAIGTLLAFIGCFISWFANGILFLYVTYGVLMGVGLGIIFVPCILIVVHYFDSRLGLANAIGSIGNGLGTVILPQLYAYLLQEYGWRGTIMILSGIILHGFVCAAIFIPPPYLKNAPKTDSPKDPKSTSCSNFKDFLRSPIFLVYLVATAIGYLGYPVPFVHLPDMAVLSGMDKYRAASLVTIMGVSNIVGRLLFGWISDFKCVSFIFLQGFSMFLCGITTAVCPHLTDFSALAAYAVIYGPFAGVFASVVAVVPVTLVGAARTGDALGVILFVCGVTITASSPTAGWLFDMTKTYNTSFYVAASCFFLSGVMTMGVMILHKRQESLKVNDVSNLNTDQMVSQIEISQSVLSSHVNTQLNDPKNTLEQIYM